MLTVLTIAFLVVAAAGILQALQALRGETVRRDYARVLHEIRWWMVPLSLASLATCLLVGTWLLLHGPEWMQWGWWSALGGQGNVYLGQTGNQGLFWSITRWLIPVGLAAVVPLLARQEEVLFRYGTETSSILETFNRSVLFGLMHLAAGVPVAAAIALTVPGSVFAVVYRLAFTGPSAPVPVGAERIDWEEYRTMPDVGDRLAWLNAQMAALEKGNLDREGWQKTRDAARNRATDVAAAAHTVSNWCAIGLLLVASALA